MSELEALLMKTVRKALELMEKRMWQLAEEERYEEAADLKEKLIEIKALLDIKPHE